MKPDAEVAGFGRPNCFRRWKPFSSHFAWLLPGLTALGFSCATTSGLLRTTEVYDPVADLNVRIERILGDSALDQSRTGIKIISLSNGETLFEKNSRLLFHPASNMKLLTTATALSRLGPSFRFKTAVFADSVSGADSTVVGNLYVKGFADPSLTTEDLWSLVQKVKSRGVKTITGNLVCDNSYLDDLYFGHGWMWDDVSSWYWPHISALTVNRNCVTVHVGPGQGLGDSLLVRLEPATSYVRIENAGLTVADSDSANLEAFEVARKWREGENTVVVRGGRPLNSEPKAYFIEVVEPALYAGVLLLELLGAEDIKVLGNVTTGVVPDSSRTLVRHSSAPLSNLVSHTNKISDNLYAELLLKTVGAEERGTPGTAENGISVIHQLFNEIGVDTTTFGLADGSGVSRYNVISPHQIIELLKAMHQDSRVQAEFKASLPIAGVDGSLENRMKGTAAEGRLRAKTGSLRGVSALSGYTTAADGELLAFSMIMEHFVVPTLKIRAIQDRIGAALSEFRRTRPSRITSTSK